MGIWKKIEEIRSRPESVRMRYVWFCVFISMALILLIWVFSLKQKNFSSRSLPINRPGGSEIMENLGKSRETAKEGIEMTKKTLGEIRKESESSSEGEGFSSERR